MTLNFLHLTNLQTRLWQIFKKSRLYGLTLLGSAQQPLPALQREYLRGNTKLGHGLIQGDFNFKDSYYEKKDLITALQSPDQVPSPLAYYVQSFTHFYDIATVSNTIIRKYARNQIELWIQTQHSFAQKSWCKLSWEPWIVGLRVSMWLKLYDFYASTADDDFKQVVRTSIDKQLRYLKRHWREETNPLYRLWALKGLCMGADYSCTTIDLIKLSHEIEALLTTQLLNDGGHKSHHPFLHCRYLYDLIELRQFLQSMSLREHSKDKRRNKKTHEAIATLLKVVQSNIEKMTPIVRMLRHVDGELVKFHTLLDEKAWGISAHLNTESVDGILSLADVQTTRPPVRAALSGFERCSNLNSVLLVNTHPNETNSYHSLFVDHTLVEETSLNLLNFEWSVGKHRFIDHSDIMIRLPNGRWLNQFDQKNLLLRIKRHTKEGSHYIIFDMDYKIHEHLIQWKRQILITPKSEELRCVDSFSIPFDCTLGIRFKINPYFSITTQGDKISITPPDAISQKRELPLKMQSHGNEPIVKKFQSHTKNQKKNLDAATKRKSKVPQKWQFHASGIDQTLTSDSDDQQNTILLMKQYEANHENQIKWYFSNSHEEI